MPHLGLILAAALTLQAPDGANVELRIVGPDGKPAANREVVLFEPSGQPGPDGNSPPEQGAVTDAAGRVRVIFKEGLWRLNVRVPGVGFGGTGLFEVRNEILARPHLPRLAKYARVEGIVAPALRKPGLTIKGRFERFPNWGTHPDDVSATCDDQGRFVFAEVLPGDLPITGLAELDSYRFLIHSEPGQTRRDVAIDPPAPLDPREAKANARAAEPRNRPSSGERITWAEGTVRDANGKPIKGVTVTVFATASRGFRSVQDSLTTETDAQGRYSIVGRAEYSGGVIQVGVQAPGRTPALVSARAPGPDDKEPRRPIDLTLPEKGGSLKVRLTHKGQPAADFAVGLGGDHPFTFDSRTDDQGVARLDNLLPGEYLLSAYPRNGGIQPGGLGGMAWRVGIPDGREVSLDLAVPEAFPAVRFQPLWPDGTAALLPRVEVRYTRGASTSIGSMDCDPEGIGTFRISERGLWPIRVRFRDVPVQSTISNIEPFFDGSALVAVSTAVPQASALRVQCDRHRLGSIRAQLVGRDGKPARGTVLLLDPAIPGHEQVTRAGTTDEEGVVLFAGLPSGPHRLRGSIERDPPAYTPRGNGPLPDDSALRDQYVFPKVEVKLEGGQEARVTLGPKRVGYLRARIRPPKDARATDIHIWTGTESDLATRTRRDPATGETVIGPLNPGEVAVNGWRWAGEEKRSIPSKTADIPEGGVARIDLQPADLVAGPLTDPAPAVRPLDDFGGTVFLHDGKTPASLARAVLLAPGRGPAPLRTSSDPAGKLDWHGLALPSAPPADAAAAKDQVATPTMVVSLPGVTGAAVIPLDLKAPGPIRVVLPPPLRATGRVTLAGKGVDGEDAILRVVAGHRGRAGLDKVLSVEGLVEAGGRFTLEGLTPGNYRVQAARDGIWLSRSIPLTVEPGKPIPELTLDIPAPGADVTLALADDRGQPLVRKGLKLERPDGPLASLWPERLETDLRGVLTIPALEVGTHAIRIDGEDAPRTFDVPDRSKGPTTKGFTVPQNQGK